MKLSSIVKIADIQRSEVSESLKNKLDEFARYSDNKHTDDLFNSWDLLNNEDLDTDMFSLSNWDEIKQIEEICVDNECDYFRLID
jgi:hypothetical protein